MDNHKLLLCHGFGLNQISLFTLTVVSFMLYLLFYVPYIHLHSHFWSLNEYDVSHSQLETTLQQLL